jgi:hypothetical protein
MEDELLAEGGGVLRAGGAVADAANCTGAAEADLAEGGGGVPLLTGAAAD